ncbi:MAG: hypothetical protein IJ037_10385 [Clostridia bacterium]|nr:hypothetical protein [Clostridia bacterium]
MKKNGTKKNTGIPAMIVTAVLFAVLLLLTGALTTVFLATSAEVDTFDLAQVTSGRDDGDIDITGYFLPEFAGITSGGERWGISASANIVGELFRLASPAITEILTPECLAGEIDTAEWTALAEEKYSVYLRFHERTPLSALTLFTGLYSGSEPDGGVTGYASELLLLPYGESIEHKTGIMRAAVRDTDGTAHLYIKLRPDEMLTPEDLEQTVTSYRSSLGTFVFAGEDYSAASPTEPVFVTPVEFRNIIIIGDTGTLLAESDDESEKLLRVFDINPDKLLSSHTESDGTRTFVDTQGMLSIRKDGISYQSTSDGGIRLSDITGVMTDDASLHSYIGAAVVLWREIHDIGETYVGEDASLQLSGISAGEGVVKVSFAYAVDNLRIMTGIPAFTAVFENGILRSAELHTIGVLNLGTRGQSANEWWFFDTISAITPQNVTLVYRAEYASLYSLDYDADLVSAEWAAITAQPEDGRRVH